MRPSLICCVILLLCSATETFADGFEKTEYKADSSRTLQYALLKPQKVEDGKKYPLLLSLHGAGGRGNKNWERNCFANKVLSAKEMRSKYPCFILAPTVSKQSSWKGASMDDVLELAGKLLTKLPIDPDRVYVTGQSMGGGGTYEAMARKPDLFAAGVPVCGGNKVENAKKMAAIPIWAFHGEKDRVVHVERGREMIEAIKKAGGKPRYSELPGVRHNSWTPAYKNPELWKWLFAQKKKKVKSL
ncbi:MAG: phospholipase [Planctomycetes bacterium]|nr:phospholipase [Planctomycetota bacterium]|tara:strand:+ start:723 stop:1454 length:732 start_codon:yes stop_codon:yes gene_type:complete